MSCTKTQINCNTEWTKQWIKAMHTAVYMLNNCFLLLSMTSCISLINCGFNVQLPHWKGTDPSTWAWIGFHSMTRQLPVFAFFDSAVGTSVWQFFHLLLLSSIICEYLCQYSCRNYEQLISISSKQLIRQVQQRPHTGSAQLIFPP